VNATDPRWTRIRDELARIHGAPPAERPALIAALDDDVRREVESLLGAIEHDPSFLRLPGEGDVRSGARLGPYVLGDEIGRGGMGVVYRAERSDGEFTRGVAVKIAGGRLFGPEAERRFIQERQILAGLDHPNIVRLLDGGVSNGWRYFVMELAEGTPVTDYCDKQALPLRARLALFGHVCAAIHYAHQRLILHRDLKPANIIATTEGVVKVLDFGIAQILQSDAVESGAATSLHPYSLACASPEQLRGEALSLASDTYSLGVLLYELVTGTNPQHRPGETFEQTYRRIANEEIAPPGKLARGVSRDLDAIVLKAMAKQPGDRYASVSELLADVDRLVQGRPVLARSPGGLYVFGKLVRRHKTVTAMTATLVALVAIGAAVYVRQARIEQRRFEDARRLINAVVQEIQPKLESIPATLPLRQILIERTMTYLESVSRDAGTNVQLLQELANAYAQLARVQGDVSTSTLGNQSAAGERFQKAESLIERAAALAPSDGSVMKDAALLHGRLAGYENLQGREDKAVAYAKRAVEYAERLQVARPGDFDAREIMAFSVFYLALAAPAADWELRATTFERAGTLYRQLAAERPDKESLRRNAGISDRYLALMHQARNGLAAAKTYAARALAATERQLAARPNDPALQIEVAIDAELVASVFDSANEVDAALPHHRQAIAIDDAIVRGDPKNARAKLLLADAERGFARNRLMARETATARTSARRAVDLYETFREAGKLTNAVGWRLATATATLGDIEAADAHGALACDAYRRAVAMFDAIDREAPLVDLVKVDANRARESLVRCQ
jgi:eukaryotic-like serine/threonine-protein kinase